MTTVKVKLIKNPVTGIPYELKQRSGKRRKTHDYELRLMARNDDAFTGLEAAIVLIGVVVVAGVLAYTVVSSGTQTARKAEQSIYGGVEEVSTGLQLGGGIYAIKDVSSDNIVSLRIPIISTPGSSPIDLIKTTVSVATPDAKLDHIAFDVSPAGTTVLKSGEQVDILVQTQPIPKSTQFIIEIFPNIGNSLVITRTTPSVIDRNIVLYQ